jgi:phosphate transport system substrate-binding protein
MNSSPFRRTLAAWALLLATAPVGAQDQRPSAVALDPDLQSYRPLPALSGALASVGSDTLHPLVKAWGERFREYYPNVALDIEAKGSNTAPPALIEGKSQICPMSRALSAAEIDAFEKKFGYRPRAIRAAVDTICIFVHKDNPLRSISLDQVDGIFSATRRRGVKELRTWGDLGLTGEWADRPIRTFGRNSLSGTRQFFRDHALKGGTFREDLREVDGSEEIIKEVSADPSAIGYCGVGYTAPGVRALPLAPAGGQTAVEPAASHAYKGDYPLSRILFLFINLPPNAPPDSPVREFVRMICSREGQEVVLREGYFPMPAAVAKEEAAKAN